MHELGCIDFVTKPFIREEILKRVQKYLGNPPVIPDNPSDEGVIKGDQKTDPKKCNARENPNEIYKIRDVPADKLEEGMILGGDLLFPKGTGTLASAGVRLSGRMIEKIREMGIESISIKVEEKVQ
jgi:hypothetical protein